MIEGLLHELAVVARDFKSNAHIVELRGVAQCWAEQYNALAS